MTMPVSVAMPKQAMKPTQTATLKLKPNRHWNSTPPTSAPGTAIIISTASMKSL